MEDRYRACMLLHALGDTIGFKNGDWEFNYGNGTDRYEDTLELLYEFIALGGINGLDIDGWLVSDDTVLHLAVAESLLKGLKNNVKPTMSVLGPIFKDKYIDAMTNMKDRFPGHTLIRYIKKLREGMSWDETPYNNRAGGSGASMRSSCIGLFFSGKSNRSKLLEIALESSRITHNSATGYLGGLVAALFTAYAIEGIEIEKWPFKLLKLLESDVIDNYLKGTRGLADYVDSKDVFISKWSLYIDNRFKDGKPLFRKTTNNLVYRGRHYYEHYAYIDNNKQAFIGSGGDDSVIIAYDCLLDSDGNFEKLVIYAMLHIGDTDTTGSIAGSWFGAMYGLDRVPKHYIPNMEYNEKIDDVAKKIFNVVHKT